MLHRLIIKNYALIDSLNIEFDGCMNIITGETGAGKSILLGALGLILGERADTKVLFDSSAKCVVEAHFDISSYHLQDFFAAAELDYDAHTIVRREINPAGKSRAFINDTPVTLTVLQGLGEKLVNLHNQQETLDLVQSGFQLAVVDALAKNKSLLESYQAAFSTYKQDRQKLTLLTGQHSKALEELDYLRFQFQELAEAHLECEEQATLEEEQNLLGNVEDIKRSLESALQILDQGDYALLAQLREIQVPLKSVRNLSKEIDTLCERLSSAYEELKDISSEAERLQEQAALDPERLQEITDRLDLIYRLQKKHRVDTVAALLQLQDNLGQRIAGVAQDSDELTRLTEKIAQQKAALLQTAAKLHSNRDKVLRSFQNNVVILLAKVGMENATFKVSLQELPENRLSESGFTEVKFLFSANKGFAPQEIKEIASGGELSRLMLCIKSLVAEAAVLPSMVFDEIDSGISGGIALKVGELMKKIALHHQLIAITHLPQIARIASRHLYIYKETKGSRTYTRMKELQGEDRVLEIAKMLSGERPTESALANARELIAS